VPIQPIKTIASYRPEWVGLPRKGAAGEEDDEDRFKPEARSSANRPGRTTPGNRRGHQQAPSTAPRLCSASSLSALSRSQALWINSPGTHVAGMEADSSAIPNNM
jgi:hypothetical protein